MNFLFTTAKHGAERIGTQIFLCTKKSLENTKLQCRHGSDASFGFRAIAQEVLAVYPIMGQVISRSGVVISKLKAVARRILRPPLHRPDHNVDHVVLGTEYGGWPLIVDETKQGALIFSFGIGEDISFDLAAIEKFGCVVHGFDPTPRCEKWVKQQSLPAAFHFHLVGLGATEGELEFFAPEKGEHVSYSAQPAPNSDLALKITAPVQRLEKIVDEIGAGAPDILKMDIEGFEYDVIDDILSGPLRPHQWLIEFHHRMYGI
jgi:FkbM family methyltransferase